MALLRLPLLAAVLALVGATNVEDCGSAATINNVVITGCPVSPCEFHRGTNITVNIDFKNNEASNNLITKVTGTIAGVEIPWTGIDPNGCDGLTKGKCPLQAEEESHYTTTAPILMEYPPVNVIVTWKMVADSGKNTICFIVPVQLIQ